MRVQYILFLVLVFTCIFHSCKQNKPIITQPQYNKEHNEELAAQRQADSIRHAKYSWMVGTWLSAGEQNRVSDKSIVCMDDYGNVLWSGNYSIDEDEYVIVDGSKKFKLSHDKKTLNYPESGYPLIKYESYSLPSDYKWLIGIWSDGDSFVYITENERIGFYDGLKNQTNKGIFMVDEGMLFAFLENQSEDCTSFTINSRSKSLAYEGGDTELWKLKSNDEIDKLVKMNQKKRIIGEWINETTPGYDAYHLIFSENGRGRYAMVINNRIVTDERFTWELNGNEIKTKNTHTGINTAANTGGVETYTYLESSDEIKGYGDGAYFKRNKHIKLLDDGSAESLESRIKIDATDGYEDIDCSVKHIRTLSLKDFIDMMLSKNQQRSGTIEKLESLKNQVYDIPVKIYRATCDETESTLYVVNSNNQIVAKVSDDAFSGVFYEDDGSAHMSWGNINNRASKNSSGIDESVLELLKKVYPNSFNDWGWHDYATERFNQYADIECWDADEIYKTQDTYSADVLPNPTFSKYPKVENAYRVRWQRYERKEKVTTVVVLKKEGGKWLIDNMVTENGNLLFDYSKPPVEPEF